MNSESEAYYQEGMEIGRVWTRFKKMKIILRFCPLSAKNAWSGRIIDSLQTVSWI